MPDGQNRSKRSRGHDSNHNDVRAQLRDRTHGSSNTLVGIQIDEEPTPSWQDRELLSSSAETPTQHKNEDLIYYPAYCHKASPTWFEWVKLTAHDVHTRLHIREGYQHSWVAEHRFVRDVPQLMFYFNHPIQFVQVTGVVVSFDEYFDRFWLFTIDDSSGLTIDVVCRKPTKERSEVTRPDALILKDKSEEEKEEEKEVKQLSNLVISTVELGSVLQVKGVITLFRRGGASGGLNDLKSNVAPRYAQKEELVRQISLQRLSKVHDTNQEIKLIAARTQFYSSVLAQPWTLTQAEQTKLHREALGEIEHDKKRAKRAVRKRLKLVETEKEDAEKIQQEYQREEEGRVRDAEAARNAGERLKGRLERERMRLADEIAPIPDRHPRSTKPGDEKDGGKRKGHKQRQDAGRSGRVSSIPESSRPDTTNDSFGPLEDEKSALLRLAFG